MLWKGVAGSDRVMALRVPQESLLSVLSTQIIQINDIFDEIDGKYEINKLIIYIYAHMK